MGCDIHSVAEVRVNGQWQPLEFENPFYNPDRVAEWAERNNLTVDEYVKKNGSWDETTWEKTTEPFPHRNYQLFARLANVRNASGLEPISEPRGIPEDTCHTDFLTQYGCDGHSHSHLTLAELRKGLLGEGEVEYVGVLDWEAYMRLTLDGEYPAGWCGGVAGPNHITIDETVAARLLAEMAKLTSDRAALADYTREEFRQILANFLAQLLADATKKEGRSFGSNYRAPELSQEELREAQNDVDTLKLHVATRWSKPTSESFEAYRDVIENMAKCIPEGGTEDDIRVCFFFDN